LASRESKKALIEEMRATARDFDVQGKKDRASPIKEYKAKEWFDAATKLREAADATEYVLA